LQLQPEKCVFAKDKVTYLGLELSYRGTEASPDKVKAVQNFPTPQSLKDVRSFLGLASFYRRLVPHFADIAKALTQLTKSDKIWDWNQECQESLNKLKSKLSNTTVLAFPDFKVPFILKTDASTVGLGAVLSEMQEGIERPISFASRQHNRKTHQKNKAYYDKKAKERKFEVHDKVYLFCPARKPGRCHKFRSFWQGPFIVVQKLSDLNYKIVNRNGKEFVVHINRLKKSYDKTPWSF